MLHHASPWIVKHGLFGLCAMKCASRVDTIIWPRPIDGTIPNRATIEALTAALDLGASTPMESRACKCDIVLRNGLGRYT